MLRFSDESLKRALGFLRTGARPLERRLARARFEGWSFDPVLEALASFRNADGGFGRGIEPDVRTPASSALGTCLALRVLREAGCGADEEMVRGAIDFLVGTCDRRSLTWRVVPPDANEHPHAPWWHDAEGSLAKTFDGFRIIPRALAVSHLHAFSKLVPPALLADVTEAAIDAIERAPVLGSGGGSDLEYAIELAETPDLAPDLRGRLGRRIRTAIPDVVVREPARWGTYCITPLRIAPRHGSFGADLIRDDVEAHLDFTVRTQSEDGAWDPTWDWGDSYPDAWSTAREEWRGILTLDALTSLRAFGRS